MGVHNGNRARWSLGRYAWGILRMELVLGLFHLVTTLPAPSQGQQLSSESLQHLLERALTPLVDEVKQRGLAPACPSCQRLHKKILVPGTMGYHAPLYFSVRAGGRESWA